MKKRKYGIGLCLCLIAASLAACSGGLPNKGTELPPAKPGNAGDAAGQGGAGAPAQGGAPFDPSERQTVTVSMFFPDDSMKEAKKKYEAKHPNITIDIQDVDVEDSQLESALEKYVTTTNAAMLSGKGPDLLVLDSLPSEKYVGKGLLADLSDWLKQDPSFKSGDYFNNILENSSSKGGLYSIPLSFFLNVLIGDEDAIAQTGVKVDDKTWNWASFAETTKRLAEKGPYKSAFATVPQYLLSEMVKENYTQFVDEENRASYFDSAAFTDLLAQVKSLYDEGVINGDGRGMSYFRPMNVNSGWDYLVALKESGMKARLYARPQTEGAKAGGYFYPYKAVGLNAKSKVKGAALDFLRFMMSDELQPSPERAGFPINKRVYEKQVQELEQEGTIKAYEEGPLKGQSFSVDKAELERLESYLSEAVHPVSFQPTKIEEIVTEESQAFFAGQKSAQETAKLIQNKAMTYLNE